MKVGIIDIDHAAKVKLQLHEGVLAPKIVGQNLVNRLGLTNFKVYDKKQKNFYIGRAIIYYPGGPTGRMK